ncbi:MAG: hypothetical protein CR994_02630 [Maribacter sp.]|nr:MAG: hypothetical protein CR994_02630 [Maribacter sp.]
MPANPKYLNKSPWQRFAKLSAGVIGGYIISALLHMVLALALPFHKEMLISSIFTLYVVWVVLLIVPYLFKNGWMAWIVYLGAILVLYGLYYLANQHNPFI